MQLKTKTAQVLNELDRELSALELDIPVSLESAVLKAVERLVELEPTNAELDGWRDLVTAGV